MNRKYDPEQIAELYREGLPLREIRARVGCGTSTIYNSLAGSLKHADRGHARARPDYDRGVPETALRKTYDIPEEKMAPNARRLLEMFRELPKEKDGL